ncbi:MAG: nuclear transport factor 2 family protein [Gammaproteobacteria bacterium]|jgi:ketosteroid isomerase-like protein|nr:nuclear transport factor 2 family protein [Gammaproteobacteria bacterium]MBU1408963.1 nuclear transport factor 2 family protein [Gammaproteobacteria bacterium]MBU1533616.1 nuclear transport factor 2 family protein [Gammaproteobacteria bacterium]
MSDPDFSTPEAVEAAFYAAFEARSLDAMMAAWAGDDSIACIHPLAAPLNGRAAVAAGWHSMFEAAGQFRVQVETVHEMREAGQVIRIVREYLIIGQETEPRPPILATNVYRRQDDGWRMVLHHASPLHVGGTPPARTPPVVLH